MKRSNKIDGNDTERQIRSLKRQRTVFRIVIIVLVAALAGGIYFIHQRRRAYDIRVAQLETRDSENRNRIKEYQKKEEAAAASESAAAEPAGEDGQREAGGLSADGEAEGTESPENSEGPEGTESPEDSEDTEAGVDTGNSGGSGKSETGTAGGNVSLCMVGNLLINRDVNESCKVSANRYDYSSLFKYVRNKISHVDAAFINQDTPAAGVKYGLSSGEKLNAGTEAADAIAKAGFDAVLHAGTHTLDKGASGLLADLRNWESTHPEVKVTGAYADKKDSDSITILTVRGIKIAVLNYTSGTDYGSLPSDRSYMLNTLDRAKVSRDLKLAESRADFTVVFPQWGNRTGTQPDSYENKWCRYFLKLGADLVIGSSLEIQPVRWMKDSEGNKMLVYYSLGNFTGSSVKSTSGNSAAGESRGGMANVILSRDSEGKVFVRLAKFYPLVSGTLSTKQISACFTGQYEKKEAETHGISRTERQQRDQAREKYFKDVIDKEFLQYAR